MCKLKCDLTAGSTGLPTAAGRSRCRALQNQYLHQASPASASEGQAAACLGPILERTHMCSQILNPASPQKWSVLTQKSQPLFSWDLRPEHLSQQSTSNKVLHRQRQSCAPACCNELRGPHACPE